MKSHHIALSITFIQGIYPRRGLVGGGGGGVWEEHLPKKSIIKKVSFLDARVCTKHFKTTS